MVLWHCQIAGSTLETTSGREVAAAADDAVGNGDPYTSRPYSLWVMLLLYDSMMWTLPTQTWSPGSLIASGPSIDARRGSAYSVDLAWVDYDYDCVHPLDCHAYRDGDSHRGAYAMAAFRPSYRRLLYSVVSSASLFAVDCKTTRAPLPFPIAMNRPVR